VKTKAGSDLLAAVDAVLEGKRFVSGGLWDQDLTDASLQQPAGIKQP
jgi:hypothetical protein